MRNSENLDVKELWAMPARDFNAWRRTNDLPKLLKFFQSTLPNFGEWQATYGITDPAFLSSDEPSRFFRGSNTLYLQNSIGQDYRGKPEAGVSFSSRSLDDDRKRQLKFFGKLRYEITSSILFVPYFHWLRNLKSIKWFPIPGDNNNAFANDFSYGLWQAMETPYSEAFLFKKHQVLKMGSVVLTPGMFDSRNLDFVCLDDLTITGRDGPTHSTKISYSSCNRLTFRGCEKAFIAFEKCDVGELIVDSSRIQDLHFKDCDLHGPIFRESRLLKTSFQNTVPQGVDFDDCELIQLTFTEPPKDLSPIGLSDVYKRLRVAFQSQGNRAEVSHYYYAERFQQLRSYFNPIIPLGKGFPQMGHGGRLSGLYDLWLQKKLNGKQCAQRLGMNLLCYTKTLLYPHLLCRFLWSKRKLIDDGMDWAIWGFGEKPGRVFLWMGLVISLFTARYYWGSIPALQGKLSESLYCSAFNFATIGCEYKSGFDSLEGILGATLLGIMVAGFGNRTRY